MVAITGNGYKTLEALDAGAEVDVVLRPNLKIFKEWYEGQADFPIRSVEVTS